MKTCPNLTKFKFRKFHKFNIRFLTSLEQKVFFPQYGKFGLQAAESGKLKFKQMEACRRTIRRGISKNALCLIRTFPYIPVTKKSIASRMGKGKGGISYWISPIKKGQILFEINCSFFSKAFLVFSKARTKLPIKTKIVRIKY